jgi:hypothetical protein
MTLLLAAFACSKLETAPVASSPTTDTAPPVVETEPITCRSCAVDGGFLAGTVDDEGDLSAVEGCIRLE